MSNYEKLLRVYACSSVDDAEDELELLKVVLQSCGAVVAAAPSVAEAKEAFARPSRMSS